jgi:hypothetical protein
MDFAITTRSFKHFYKVTFSIMATQLAPPFHGGHSETSRKGGNSGQFIPLAINFAMLPSHKSIVGSHARHKPE